MDDLITGYVASVTQIPVGTQMTAPAAVGDLVLAIDDAADLEPGIGQVRIDDTVLDYDEVDDDESTITLAAPLAVAIAEDAMVWAEPSKIDATAWVLIDGASDPIPANIPQNMQDALPVRIREESERERVRLTRSGQFSWDVYDLVDQPLVRDGAYTANPFAFGYLLADTSIPSGSPWTTITNWSITDSDDVTFDPSTGLFTFDVTGTYLFVLGAQFASGAGNNRAIRFEWHTLVGTFPSRMVQVTASGATAIEVTEIKSFYAGEAVAMQVWQNSGAALNIQGLTIGELRTTCSILRVASA